MCVALFAVIVSSISTWYTFYFNSLRKTEHISVIPITFNATYDSTGLEYEASVAFINRGNIDVVISDFGTRISIPTTSERYPAAVAGRQWEKEAIILKPGASEIVKTKIKESWRNQYPNYSLPGPNINRAEVDFSYTVLSVEGELVRRSLGIHTSNAFNRISMPELQKPKNETFDGPAAPAAPSFSTGTLN